MMDIVLLRVAVSGAFLVTCLTVLSSFNLQWTTDPSSQPTTAATPKDVSVSCWTPAYFTSSQVKFMEDSCLINFHRYLQNATSPGVSADSRTGESAQLKRARAALIGQPMTDVNDDNDNNNNNSSSSMTLTQMKRKQLKPEYIFLLVQFGISVIIYSTASWVRSVALNTGLRVCIKTFSKNAAQRSTDDSNNICGTQGDLMSLVRSLRSSYSLGVTYIVLQIAAILFWFTLAAVTCQTALQSPVSTPGQPGDLAVNWNNNNNNNNDNNNNYNNQKVGGTFSCTVDIQDASNTQRFSFYCLFEGSATPSHLQYLGPGTKEGNPDVRGMVLWCNTGLCFTLGLLHLVYILYVYVFSVRSRQAWLSSMMQGTHFTPISQPSFIISDLYAASVLTM